MDMVHSLMCGQNTHTHKDNFLKDLEHGLAGITLGKQMKRSRVQSPAAFKSGMVAHGSIGEVKTQGSEVQGYL